MVPPGYLPQGVPGSQPCSLAKGLALLNLDEILTRMELTCVENNANMWKSIREFGTSVLSLSVPYGGQHENLDPPSHEHENLDLPSHGT